MQLHKIDHRLRLLREYGIHRIEHIPCMVHSLDVIPLIPITNLQGLPLLVMGPFNRIGNIGELKSFEGWPIVYISDDTVFCGDTTIPTTLKGCPLYCSGFSCFNNMGLTTLEGGPIYIEDHYYLKNLPKLRNFKGAPHYIEGGMFMGELNLDSLEGFPRNLYNVSFRNITVNGKLIKHKPKLQKLLAQQGVNIDISRISKVHF